MKLLSREPSALAGCYKADWAYPGDYESRIHFLRGGKEFIVIITGMFT